MWIDSVANLIATEAAGLQKPQQSPVCAPSENNGLVANFALYQVIGKFLPEIVVLMQILAKQLIANAARFQIGLDMQQTKTARLSVAHKRFYEAGIRLKIVFFQCRQCLFDEPGIGIGEFTTQLLCQFQKRVFPAGQAIHGSPPENGDINNRLLVSHG
jgi:hypothetical protein